jgi:hypothetical protein
LLRCGKSLYQRELASVLRCNTLERLAGKRRILYLWRPAVLPGEIPRRRSDGDKPPDRQQDVMTGSPWETATRLEWQLVWAFPVQEARRQVGPIELQAQDADEGQRVFSWLLFS